MALASRDPSVITRYNTMALEHLAKAHAIKSRSRRQPMAGGDAVSGTDRD
jgi:hypothetical protein